jgi:hypothetical protein
MKNKMAKIIKEREYQTASRTELNFYEKETGEVCFGFPLVNGIITPCREGKEPNTYEPCAEEECAWWDNYLFVKDNEKYYSEVETDTWWWHEPAIALCECGKEIALNYDAEECPYCGRLHNLFGQELLPRHMWEEDY